MHNLRLVLVDKQYNFLILLASILSLEKQYCKNKEVWNLTMYMFRLHGPKIRTKK